MSQPVLLLMNLNGERYSKIRLMAMRFRIRVCPVKPESFGVSLGQLCEGSLPEPLPPAQPFTDEMMVMAYFPNMLLQQFVQSFRRMGIAPVLLKAILTDTNQDWSPEKLHAELSAEREAILAGSKAEHGENA